MRKITAGLAALSLALFLYQPTYAAPSTPETTPKSVQNTAAAAQLTAETAANTVNDFIDAVQNGDTAAIAKMFIYPKGLLLAGQQTCIINNEQEFTSYCSNLFNKYFAQSLHKQSSADMFFDGLHYATADKRIWLEEYNGKAYIAAVFTDAEHKNGLAAYEGSSNAAMENMQPISVKDGSFKGSAVDIKMPIIENNRFQAMQDYFSSNIAQSLYAYLPYYSNEYGQPNPLYLQDSYTFEEITDIAKVADFVHKRQNIKAEERQEYSNRYHMYADYEVKLNNSAYVSILQSIYTYSGGAHGMTIRYSMTANRATGEILKLADLFADKTYLGVLNELAKDQNKDKYLFDKVQLTGNEDFYLTDKGLTVYFQLYEVAPYAAGFVEYFFPYDEIAPLMYKNLI